MGDINKLIRSSIQLAKKYNYEQSLYQQSQQYNLQTLLNNINLSTLGINRSSKVLKGIGFKNLFLSDFLRISLYYIPKNEVMQCHDHPNMQIVNYLVKGLLEAKLYTEIQQQGLYTKTMTNVTQKEVSLIDGMKSKERNLHEFKAIQPTYFLDIIFPDYDDNHTCTFYKQKEQISKQVVKLQRVEPDYMEYFQL